MPFAAIIRWALLVVIIASACLLYHAAAQRPRLAADTDPAATLAKALELKHGDLPEELRKNKSHLHNENNIRKYLYRHTRAIYGRSRDIN